MITDRRGMLALGALGAATLAQAPAQAQAPAPQPAPAPAAPALPYRAHTVRSPDGVNLAVYDYGNPAGQPILLVHGYAQAAMSWDRQTGDPGLAREFRLVALDLRGHGMSDKPIGDEHYRTGKRWADDIKAVMDALALTRPVLVGWSYGGRVMGDYIAEHGHRGLGAMNWVCAVSSSNPAGFGRGGRFIGQMVSPDPATAIRGTVSFLRECFEIQPTTGDFETMLAFNMMVPRHARISLGGRQASYEAPLRALDIPVLVTHGQRDKLITLAMAQQTAGWAPGARLSVFEEIGHAPFWEDAPRFNRELAELARSVRR
jgi:pimeloyl-ACP methyl ester carboxylesterase